MKLNQELEDAIAETGDSISQSAAFQKRFTRLIRNYMDGMYTESEIADVIQLVELTGEQNED